jgi:catechol 2,3-dioxygenase-like lactoylglutathione lyase family enzyme
MSIAATMSGREGFMKCWDSKLSGKCRRRNTPEVAAAVGMPPYFVRGALLQLEGSPQSPLIDLLQWKEPHDTSPPYKHLYHLGIARIALLTSDLAADVQVLKSQGVEFISEPVLLAPSDSPPTRFVCFKDPDGTVLELVESQQLTAR